METNSGKILSFRPRSTPEEKAPSPAPARYAELQVTSNYSFLRGASHPEELLLQAKAFGIEAIAITDRNTLAGILRTHGRAKDPKVDMRLVIGCRLDLQDGTSLLAYPTDRAAYARLCQMLSAGKRRAGKGACSLTWDDVAAHAEGQFAILLPDEADAATEANLRRLHRAFGERASLALTLRRRSGDAVRLRRLSDMAQAAGVATVVTGDVLYHEPGRRVLQDVMTCIREGCTIDAAGHRLERFADRHLRAPQEMARLFADYPEALARTIEITGRCTFSLSDLQYQYPDESERPGETAQQALERHVWASVPDRYGDGLPEKVHQQLLHELALIAEMRYAPYFLTVNTIVREAVRQGILCQGRGSAANSAVCYVLGITAIDPVAAGLLFERFVSANRNEPPDIDVDFEHERREDIIQWIYRHYGRDRAALCATIVRYRARGAVREVGKVMGLTEDVTAALASQVWGWSEDGVEPKHAEQLNLNLADRRLRLTLDIARQLIGHPRHMSQHPGGFVLTRDKLADLVPIEPASMVDRQVIEWDKDDIDILRFMKVDILGLGMLGCLRRAFDLIERHRGGPRYDIASIPQDDKPTYEMIQQADTLGTFQIESRAQMSMLPRHRPADLYDLTIQVAIVRPGPIQGDMVHPYLRRRLGLEKPDYVKPELEAVLKKTLGVPLFQEQAMRVAIVGAGFTPDDADQLRRSMATFKQTGGVGEFRDRMINGMVANGYPLEFAERTFKQIEGFGSYGFPESHAASFALIAYASSWVKRHHPDAFCAALLNAQPMGFYAPAQIVRDARRHVTVRPVCVNASAWDCTLEPDTGQHLAVRLGLRMVKGLAQPLAEAVLARRGEGYASVEDMWRRAAVPVAALERLAEADAFAGLSVDRRQALWAIRGLGEPPPPLLLLDPHPDPLPEEEGEGWVRAAPARTEPTVQLRPMTEGHEVVEDYQTTGLTLRQHPVYFLRSALRQRGMVTCESLAAMPERKRVVVPGIVLVRQKPGSAKGVMFITIEDETGIANLVLWPDLFEKQRRLVLSAGMIACRGRVQRDGEVIHVVVEHLTDLSRELRSVGRQELPFPIQYGRGDGATHPASADSREQVAAASWRTRDIYVADRTAENSHIKVPTRDFR